ncbi:alpha/beta hydrolase-fold protein [Sediminitomix flava]|uniref:Putative alpha/beta superfamily hydrolase n=1 Tax=Sediminitomix flava TaxID=379075 RepID=A0A315Z138_SEDFL|nr:alpha/beta hydrolase-fold protein [Sediminitomix flava]PWJ36025.1 putative alpha/beta superfamily hydrolase [Sediminitomix flava]
MKVIFNLTLLFTFLSFFACSNQQNAEESNKKEISFIVTSPDLDSDTDVYISGGDQKLGAWHPQKVALDKLGDHKWKIDLEFEKGLALEYKFTLGSWSNEAADSTGNPLSNFILKVTDNENIHHEIKYWKEGGEMPIRGQITGKVEYLEQLKGEGILPRDVIVWLPKEYEANPDKRYPVLYMHDGQNIIDPKTASFGVDWAIDETATELINNKEIQPFIIVGAYCTENRTPEYSPGKEGSAYMDFMVNTLKSIIDKKYRTKTGREHTIVGGSSSGGIISFMLAWEYPQIYSGAICMSPAFKIQDIDYVDDVLAYTGKKKDLKFYIDNGGIGLEQKLQPGIDEMIKVLQEKGYILNQDLFYVIDENAQHNEAAWAKRMPKALKLFF